MAVASAGWTWGAITFGFCFFDFMTRGVPGLEAYCQTKYGAQWDEYKKKTPYNILPGVF